MVCVLLYASFLTYNEARPTQGVVSHVAGIGSIPLHGTVIEAGGKCRPGRAWRQFLNCRERLS